MSQMIIEAFKLMGIGVGTVFLVLAIFYFLIIGLLKIFPAKGKE
ncbi:MAG: OadG family protein [Bacillota bacterium]|nr:OadG family protein [Bacillota bacterium]